LHRIFGDPLHSDEVQGSVSSTDNGFTTWRYGFDKDNLLMCPGERTQLGNQLQLVCAK